MTESLCTAYALIKVLEACTGIAIINVLAMNESINTTVFAFVFII